MAVHERSPSHKADLNDPEELALLDAAIVALRSVIFFEVEPESLLPDVNAAQIFQNLCAMQIEYCRAIRQLTIDGHILPAAALLRTVLEVSTRFAWASINFPQRKHYYLEQKRFAGMASMMNELAWNGAYEKLYGPLCDFTHANYGIADLQRENVRVDALDIEDLDRALAFIPIFDEVGKIDHLSADIEMPPNKLLSRFGQKLSVRAFDFVVTMLIRGAGVYADSKPWWHNRLMHEWDRLASNFHKEMPILWYWERQRLIVHRKEGWFNFDPGAA
ncbi:hypothetical protein [Paracoccus methylarcula]|uniref:Uncharacterized protein n=1 Tax=Paracoccus methylarcula TaxID=72022 RepID=A0A422QZD9_9RHOB|nr:hypothetical protein [Paracoccus methylarcula]RNF35332.1 hypothetical protein A7A09_006975 [Paracoccus methylarcula]